MYWFQCSLRVPPSAKIWSRVIRIPRASAMCSNTVYATESMITIIIIITNLGSNNNIDQDIKF